MHPTEETTTWTQSLVTESSTGLLSERQIGSFVWGGSQLSALGCELVVFDFDIESCSVWMSWVLRVQCASGTQLASKQVSGVPSLTGRILVKIRPRDSCFTYSRPVCLLPASPPHIARPQPNSPKDMRKYHLCLWGATGRTEEAS